MGANASRVAAQVDKLTAATLRASGGADLTTTTTETAVSLNELRTAYWHNFEIPHGKITVPVVVSKADTGGTNAYTLELLVDDTAAMSDTPVSLGKVTIPPGAVGEYEFVVDSKSIPALDPDHASNDAGKWIAIKAGVTGDTTPKLNYSAWLGHCRGA